MNAIHEETYKGFTIEIHVDEFPCDPRKEYDHAGNLIFFHSRYNLGEQNLFDSPQECIDILTRTKAYFLPVYLNDHSGLRISAAPFSCHWDSGQIGFIYISREDAHKKFGPRPKSKTMKLLQAEIIEYDCYISGQVYGYIVKDSSGNDQDSCWGFYGEIDYVISQAREFIDYQVKALDNFKRIIGRQKNEN